MNTEEQQSKEEPRSEALLLSLECDIPIRAYVILKLEYIHLVLC